jgi:hypothetical protein
MIYQLPDHHFLGGLFFTYNKGVIKMTRWFVMYKGMHVAGPFRSLSEAQTAKNKYESANQLYGMCSIKQV